MTLIIGIDPGSRSTGYGIIQMDAQQTKYVDSGYIPLMNPSLPSRLQRIFSVLQEVIFRHQPNEGAIEQVFMHQNPHSALKLGQARGAAIIALGAIPLAEYSARQVKQSVVGYGAAKKEQVQEMVRRLLNMKKTFQPDEADALAIALCHAHSRNIHQLLASTKTRRKKNSWRSVVVIPEPE